MAAIDNDDTSAHYETHHNVFAYSEMGLKSDFAGHSNSHHHNVYAYPEMCGYLSEYHPHALDGYEDHFFSNFCAQYHTSYYIMGQTCNYTQPDLAWTAVPGAIPSYPDLDLDTMNATLQQAQAACGGWCVGLTWQGASANFTGVGAVRLSKVGGVAPTPGYWSWVLPNKAGLTVVYNNTLYTPWGQVAECGLNLTDWQAQDPEGHDVGTTVGTWPDDADFVATMRVVLGLPPCNNCTPPDLWDVDTETLQKQLLLFYN